MNQIKKYEIRFGDHWFSIEADEMDYGREQNIVLKKEGDVVGLIPYEASVTISGDKLIEITKLGSKLESLIKWFETEDYHRFSPEIYNQIKRQLNEIKDLMK